MALNNHRRVITAVVNKYGAIYIPKKIARTINLKNGDLISMETSTGIETTLIVSKNNTIYIPKRLFRASKLKEGDLIKIICRIK